MHQFEGKVISFEDVVKLPPRKIFLDVKEMAITRDTLEAGEPIEFLPTSHMETYLPEKAGMFSTDKYALRAYKLILFGIFKTGEKATVIIDGVLPNHEIRVPNSEDPNVFMAKIQAECTAKSFKVHSFEITHGATMKEFEDNADFIKLSFTSLSHRRTALMYLHERYETYHNDTSSYYKVICRDTLNTLTCWCTITDYRVEKNAWIKTAKTLRVGLDGWRPFGGTLSENMIRDKSIVETWDIETDDPSGMESVPRPESNTAVMFKIGVNFAFVDSDIMPADGEPGDEKYKYAKPKGYLAMYMITTIPVRPRPNRVTILVRDERQAVEAKAILTGLMKPDYLIGFNDSNYDWDFYVKRAYKYGMLNKLENIMSVAVISKWAEFEGKPATPPSVLKYYWYRKYICKLSAELSVDGYQLAYPGYQCIDLMPQLRASNNNPEKYSLNVFLKKYKLSSKVDMPYQRMFAIRRLISRIWLSIRDLSPLAQQAMIDVLGLHDIWEQLLDLSTNVAEYCQVDAAKCQDLLQRTFYIRDKRVLANNSFVSMEDAINRAGGMKVRNITAAECNQRGLRINMIPPVIVEQGKYPGALVIEPEKGIFKPRPTLQDARREAINGNKIYAIFRTLTDEDIKNATQIIIDHGIHLQDLDVTTTARIAEMHPAVKFWFALNHNYPIGGLDFASLYPNIILDRNLSPEMLIHDLKKVAPVVKRGLNVHNIDIPYNGRHLKAWSVRHDYTGASDECRGDRKTDVEHRFGVFPSILNKLFNARKQMKAQLKPLAKRKEELEMMSSIEFAKHQEEYSEVMFKYNYIDSGQKAAKVLMNTFYGEAGNARSPICVRVLAGGVTAWGQFQLRTVQSIVQREEWKAYYGDTDSMYVEAHRKVFKALDILYYSGQIDLNEYMKRVIELNFKLIDALKIKVNNTLATMNGTKFLNMEYEELLYPLFLLGKKKYTGRAHYGHFNPTPKELFTRGLDTVKKGLSKVLVDTVKKLTWDLCDPYCHTGVLQMINEVIHTLYITKHDPADFIKSAQYKPKKNNVSVQTFAKRMKEENRPLEPLERFQFLIPKKYGYKYDVRGRKSALSIGERMEYADKVISQKMEIDLDYYILKNITSSIARICHWIPGFVVGWTTPDQYDEAEEKSMKNAIAHIHSEASRYSKQSKSHGPLMQKLFRKINTVFQSEFDTMVGSQTGSILQQCWGINKPVTAKAAKTKQNDKKWVDNNGLYDDFLGKIDQAAIREAKSIALAQLRTAKLTNTTLADWCTLKRAYTTILTERERSYIISRNNIATRIREHTNQLSRMVAKRDEVMMRAINAIRDQWHIENMDDDVDPTYMVEKTVNADVLTHVIGTGMRNSWTSDDIRTMERIKWLSEQMRIETVHITTTREMHRLVSLEVTRTTGVISAPVTKKALKESIDQFAKEHF